jgi:class 3 adenylate cyclase
MNKARTTRSSPALTLEDFQELSRSGRELAKELRLESLLHSILDTASRLTGSPDASIILRNERQPTLYFAAAIGDQADWVLATFGAGSDTQVPIEGSKAGLVYQTGESLVENTVKDHFEGVDAETNKRSARMVCVPLSVGDKRLGVMQVLNKGGEGYGERERAILEYLADQASVAIRNARLMESLLALSGLYGTSRKTEQLLTRMEELEQEAHAENLTVLFADMRGFSYLCQSLSDPGLVQARLSEFISMLSDAVLEHDGIVNKFLGDGLMALFQGADCSVRAVKSAFAMVERFPAMKQRWNDESNLQLEFLDVGVGIATDQVILGGIGNARVRDYTAIGTAVNLAEAFERNARNGRHILCDQLTYRNAKSILGAVEAPEDFVFQQPVQGAGVKYKCYDLRTLGVDRQPRVFISHNHQDAPFIEKELVRPLKDRGVQTWFSPADIPQGALWTAEIRKAIADCNWMVVIVSKNSAGSKWVRREVDLAVAAGHLDEHIVPVIIDTTSPKEVNEFLAPIQAINLGAKGNPIATLAGRLSQA